MKEIFSILLGFFTTILCTICLDLCYAKINDKRLTFSIKNIVIIILTSLCTIINNSILGFSAKVIIALLIVSIHFKFIFNDSFKKALINYIVMFFILVLLEITVTNILSMTKILNNNNSANSFKSINLLLSIIIQLTGYLLLFIKQIKNKIKALVNFILNNINLLNIAFIILIAIAVLGILNVELFATQGAVKFITLLLFVFLLMFIAILQLKLNEYSLKINNQKLIDYNDKYGKFLDEYRIYKHNINNKLLAMKSFGNKKVNSLIDDLLNEENQFSIKNNNLYVIPNGIKGIVAEKLYNKEYEVYINNKIKNDPFISLKANVFNNFSECLGIALDNAIEASEETSKPILILELYENETTAFIKIGNNYCNNIDIDEIGNKNYSTKSQGNGLGLFSIKRNTLIKEKIEIINNMYYIELQIKKYARN